MGSWYHFDPKHCSNDISLNINTILDNNNQSIYSNMKRITIGKMEGEIYNLMYV